MTFDSFGLAPAVLRGVAALGFTSPTEVQAHAIPLLLKGRDAIVQAKTGSGKTLAFGLPLLSMLKPQNKPQALVILPTRELALQVCEAIASVRADNPLTVLPIYGGVGLGGQENALKRGVDIVVGTPGRLKDLLGRKSLDLSHVTVLVLDEADQMLDMGFRRDMEFLMERLPKREQTLIFSATMPAEIEAIARKFLKDPAIVKLVQKEEVTPNQITHHFVRSSQDDRFAVLVGLLKSEAPECAIVFTRLKHETKKIAKKIETQTGMPCGFLNGNMSQNARNTMLAKFKDGEVKVMVATDVAARGLDIEGLSHVFHYAVPTVVETYIHRSGRTGRAGNDGKTFTIVTPDAESDFKAISKKIQFEEVKAAPAVLKQVAEEPNVRPERGNRTPRPGQRPPRGERQAMVPAAEPTTWRRFKIALTTDHRHTPGSYVRLLSENTGVPREAIRGMQIRPDHATFEIAPEAVEQFMQKVRTPAKAAHAPAKERVHDRDRAPRRDRSAAPRSRQR